MIKKNELRIGNIVNCHFLTTNFNAEVLEVRHGGVMVQDGEYQNVYGYDNISPLPISPEILEKAGFDNTKGTSTSNYKYWCTIGIIDVRFREDGFTVFEVGGGVMTERKHIKYLHQMQNFYHALTGEELTIQL